MPTIGRCGASANIIRKGQNPILYCPSYAGMLEKLLSTYQVTSVSSVDFGDAVMRRAFKVVGSYSVKKHYAKCIQVGGLSLPCSEPKGFSSDTATEPSYRLPCRVLPLMMEYSWVFSVTVPSTILGTQT